VNYPRLIDKETFFDAIRRLFPLMERDEFDAMWEANMKERERRGLQ
jgi:hypothetical protein